MTCGRHEVNTELYPCECAAEGIDRTVRWYLDNEEWMDNITSGEYEKYYDSMYKDR